MTIDAPHNARSRRTRQALLGAARRLIEEDEFARLTMASVAQAAGVSRRGAYMHFASIEDLIGALRQHLGETEGLEESLQRVWDSPDAASALDEWARHIARAHPKILAVSRAIERSRSTDHPTADLHDEAMAHWHRGCTRLATWLAEDGVLAEDWTVDEAADWLWGLMSWDFLARMIGERGWSPEQFGERYAAMIRGTLLRPEESR